MSTEGPAFVCNSARPHRGWCKIGVQYRGRLCRDWCRTAYLPPLKQHANPTPVPIHVANSKQTGDWLALYLFGQAYRFCRFCLRTDLVLVS
jgi:hypothetical protein